MSTLTPSTLENELQEIGIAVSRDLFGQPELGVLRDAFDRAYQSEKIAPEAGKRQVLQITPMLKEPELMKCMVHPEIIANIEAIFEGHDFAMTEVKLNRYNPSIGNPEEWAVCKHADAFVGKRVDPHRMQAIAIFLDDISDASGALQYVPGSHKHYFIDPTDPGKALPSQEDLDSAKFIPAELKAGSVLYRVPQIWHAVREIHHLRRYITCVFVRSDHLEDLLRDSEKYQKIQDRDREIIKGNPLPPGLEKYFYYL